MQSILFVNKQVQKLTGYQDSELLNRSLTMLLPEILNEIHVNYLKNFIAKKITNLQDV
jgi:PAS domain S-box-containing protein